MAKYDVTMSCGHVQTVQLFGKMTDRENKIAWLENHGICAECAKAEKEHKHAEETAKAAEKAIAENLPDITGTEKQVNWALTIRARLLAEVDKKIVDNKDRMDAETLATAELQAKAIKKVVANKFTEARFWIDNRDSFLQKIIKDNNLAEEIKAEIANLQAAETAEVIAEDDGSNDDDYDEDEIVTVDNTDNDDDDDDDDELVDPPIETAEVQEETKMKEIKVPEASTTTETAKFEVGKVYYLDDDIDFRAIKVVRRTEKNIWFVWQGNVAIDEHRVKIHVENSGETFTYGRYKGAPKFYAVEEFNDDAKKYFTDLYHCWSAPRKAQNIADIMKSINNEVTVEVENVTTTEEVTAENNVEIAKLEKKLASLKLFPLNTDEYMQACVYSIKKYYACIAKAEEDMWQFQLEQEKYDREVAALENEIANRKLIDAIDDIGGSADAVNATVEAMIKLNAANFTAANLLDAVNSQAENAVETAPVKFELQNFAEDVNIAEGVATIDTAVTVIQVIDEDAEDADIDAKIKANVEEYANLKAEKTEIEKQIEELEKKLKAINKASLKIIDVINEEEQNLTRWIRRNVKFKNMTLVGAYGGKHCSDEYSIYASMGVESNNILISAGAFELACYSTVKNLKVAIRELASAIERGEETFTFPADIPPVTELPCEIDSNAEIAKDIWF